MLACFQISLYCQVLSEIYCTINIIVHMGHYLRPPPPTHTHIYIYTQVYVLPLVNG